MPLGNATGGGNYTHFSYNNNHNVINKPQAAANIVLINKNDNIREDLSGNGGGGQPTIAQAGGVDATKLPALQPLVEKLILGAN